MAERQSKSQVPLSREFIFDILDFSLRFLGLESKLDKNDLRQKIFTDLQTAG